LVRQVIHSDTMTVARIHLHKGCIVPEHSHHNEQISMVERGSLKFRMDGTDRMVRAGEVMRIPPHAPHAVETMEESFVTDLFSPPRQDWISGDDAYLRK